MATPIFLVDSNSPSKDLLFAHGPNLAQNCLYLVGTMLLELSKTASKILEHTPLQIWCTILQNLK